MKSTQRLRLTAALVTATLMLAAALVVIDARRADAGPPADLDKTPVITSGLNSPTAFRFTPDGNIMIAEQSGAIRLFHDGDLHTMVTLPTVSSDERGLLGLELDPDYATNHYVYVSYTHTDNFDRLSRLTVEGDSIDPASEKILLKSEQDANIFHHGGEIRFGADGKIYWALGMDLYAPNSQNLGTIHGKILRLNSDGSIPPDNPFVDTPGAEPSIWAYGLRNPFRGDFVPASAGANANKLLVGDVGGSYWEELNVIDKGGNYGWPMYEGECTGCATINPLLAYEHTDPPSSAGSITAVAVNNSDALGPAYQNAVFYGDYTLGFVRYAIMDEGYTSVLSDHAFDAQAGTPVQLSFGPDGNLYQLNIYPGALYKIGPSGGNRAPVASAAADVTNGLAPLSVQFSSEGSLDPDDAPLSYTWDFRDGTTSNEANPSHTFTANGTYDVRLTVSDGSKSAEATTRITVGNRAPTVSIVTPAAGSRYNAGDTISYSGSATDPEDGPLPASAFSWSVIFHHAEHIHPFLGPIDDVSSGSFQIPRIPDNVDTTAYEVRLTVTDSAGLEATTSRTINPNLVDLTFRSDPEGATYTIDGTPFTGTHTERAVVGVDRVVGVPSPQFVDGTQYAFANWSDGGAAAHTIRTPATDASYKATMATVGEPPAPWQSIDIGDRTVAGTTAYSGGTFTIEGGGNDIWGDTDEFRYIWQPLSGDGSIVARITGQSGTDPWAKSGVMIKESTTEGASYASLGVTPGNGMRMHWNFDHEANGGSYQFPNAWVKLTRTGNTVTGHRSADGQNWTEVGSTTIEMAEDATVGLFVNSHNDDTLNKSTFDNVTVTNPGSQPGPLPSPWERTDVGGSQPAGSASYKSTGKVFTVTGGGTDIWGDNDQSSYVHRQLTGDGTIVARVTSQDASDPWAKAGIMIKASTQARAPYAAMMATPEHGVRFQSEFNVDSSGGDYQPGQAWLKLVRTGNTFTGYVSADGVSWTRVRSRTIAMPESVTAGLFVNAHAQSAQLGGATFDKVSVTAAGGALPAGWTAGDIGGATPEGSTSFAGGTFTVSGGGRDIWGTVDEGHLAWKTLDGDGSVVARLSGFEATDDWAKAGVMIKQSATAGDPYAALLVTKGHGVHLQSQFNRDISGSASAAPRWLKLTRTGAQLAAYESANGTDWTLVGRTTVTMPSSVVAGLVVTGHDGGSSLASATFTDVSITAAGGALPAGWTAGDIGGATPEGSTSFAGGTFTVSGGGRDIWGTVDEGHLAWKTLDGDGSVVARLSGFEATDDWAKAGVMIKQSATAGDPYAALLVTKGHGVHLQSQFNRDISGSASAAPRWLKLTRTGAQLAAYESANGTDWTLVGRTTVTMPSSVVAGLVVTGHDGGSSLASATFTDVSITAAGGSAVPQPWTSSDVGAVQVPGSAVLSNGVFTVRSSGNDVWGEVDEMHFVHQPIEGDGSIVARVTEQENTNEWAKSGIMIKESASPLSDYVGLFVTPDHGVRMQSGFTRDINGGSVSLPAGWLKLERSGSTVVGYRSDDGQTWTEVGRVDTTISASARVGLSVTSHNGPVLNSSSFADVSVNP